jgi:hypothetical protein
MFFLDKSDWILFVDNRSEITILEYHQKQFHLIMKFDLGLIHLEKVEEILHGKIALLDRGGEMGFYDIDTRNKTMEQTNRLRPLTNQSIKDFLYISSVLRFDIVLLKIFFLCFFLFIIFVYYFVNFFVIILTKINAINLKEIVHAYLEPLKRHLPIPRIPQRLPNGQNLSP